jgi:protein-L-isoaspartate(D-aspartate) O-methyltransferase
MTDPSQVLRERLVQTLKAKGAIRSGEIEAAFLSVPRHAFLDGVPIEDAYTDRSFPTKYRDDIPISSSSQPAIMAIMLEQLGLRPGQRVLEIGAGTGYNAALMAQIVGDHGAVVTIDIDDDLVASARQHLSDIGLGRVEVICADGGFGYPAGSPYDRIILTVGAWDIAPAWLQQLANAGRLVLSLSIRGVQKSVAFERREEHLESVSVSDCGFIRLRGMFAGPERIVPLGPSPGPHLSLEDDRPIEGDALLRLLESPVTEVPAGIELSLEEEHGSLNLWLALEDPDTCSLGISADPTVVDRSPVPLLVEYPTGDRKLRATLALLGKRGLVALCRTSDGPLGPKTPVALSIGAFGEELTLIGRMREHLAAWDAAGRPKTESLRIRAYPKPVRDPKHLAGWIVDKKWTTLVISQD